MSATGSTTDRELVVERIFDAPRELVFKVWTEPEHIANWYGPEGMSTKVEKFDFRPGGDWRYVMVTPDGSEYALEGTFNEIVPPERLVYSSRPAGMEGQEFSGVTETVTFEDLGGKTKLTLTMLHGTVEERNKTEEMGAGMGWQSSFNKLEGVLAGISS